MVGTPAPAFHFAALILVTNCRKTCIGPRAVKDSIFVVFFGLSKYAVGSQNVISKHLWPHVELLS